jgi:hypothetical protein
MATGRIDHIKGYLEVAQGIIRGEQNLFFNDITLEDEDRLQECSIGDGIW